MSAKSISFDPQDLQEHAEFPTTPCGTFISVSASEFYAKRFATAKSSRGPKYCSEFQLRRASVRTSNAASERSCPGGLRHGKALDVDEHTQCHKDAVREHPGASGVQCVLEQVAPTGHAKQSCQYQQ